MLIVAGGKRGGKKLDSTEILRPPYTAWTYTAILPFTLKGISGATIYNNFYVAGGFSKHSHTGELFIVAW